MIGLLVATVLVAVAFFVLTWAWDLLRDKSANRFLVVGVAIAIGVGGVFFLYWAANQVIDVLPGEAA